jgi:MFS family permease
LVSYRNVLETRGFTPYWLGGAFSFAAPSVVTVVLVWATAIAYPAGASTTPSYSALALALLGLSATVPTLAAAVVSGTLADRMDRGRLMAATNLAAIGAVALLVVLLWEHPDTPVSVPGPAGFYLPLWLVFALPLWAAITTASTLFRPAFNASLPSLLPTNLLGRANGLVFSLAVGASIAGTLIATTLIPFVGESTALLVPLVLFAATGVSIAAIPRPAKPPARPPTKFSGDVAEGYRYLLRNPALLRITVGSLAVNFLTALAFVELGLYVRDFLGVTEAIYLGAMTTGATAGSGLGTVIAGRLSFEPKAGRFLVVLLAAQGFTVAAMAFSPSIGVSIPLMFLFGVFPGMFTTVFLATVQAIVPGRLLGRVLAADEVGSYGLVPIGQYAGGLITLAAGIRATFLIAGGGTAAVAGGMGAYRDLRALGFSPKPAGAARGSVSEAVLPAAEPSPLAPALAPLGEVDGLPPADPDPGPPSVPGPPTER